MATVLVLAAVTGCSGDAKNESTPPADVPAGLDSFYGQKPTWKGCGDDFQCTTVQVPLDYSKPSGEKVGISVIRLPAQDKSARIGSLLTNPGGPGGSGIDFVRQVGRAFGDDLRRRFDIVGFDPRGVAASDPVRCNDGPQLDAFFATDASPTTRTRRTPLANRAKRSRSGARPRPPRSFPMSAPSTQPATWTSCVRP